MSAFIPPGELRESPLAVRSGFAGRRLAECRALAVYLWRHWLATLAIVALYAAAKYWLWVNVSPSLPYHVVWVDYGARPQRGDLILYRFAGEDVPGIAQLDALPMFKRVAGLPGDVISVEARVVSVGGVRIGLAKPHTLTGVPLDPIAPGVIPEGYLFAQADSPDSFDSRYAQSGLVPQARVLGVAHALF